jgi:hypothetical protein
MHDPRIPLVRVVRNSVPAGRRQQPLRLGYDDCQQRIGLDRRRDQYQAVRTGTARATINGLSAFSNVAGIIADGSATTAESVIEVSNTVSAGATVAGILALTPASGGGAIAILVDRSSLINNATGASASGPKSSVFVTNTTIFGNATGLVTSGGSTLSYKTNNINGGNITDGTPTVNLSQD